MYYCADEPTNQNGADINAIEFLNSSAACFIIKQSKIIVLF